MLNVTQLVYYKDLWCNVICSDLCSWLCDCKQSQSVRTKAAASHCESPVKFCVESALHTSCLYTLWTRIKAYCNFAQRLFRAYLRLNWLQFVMAWNALITAVQGGRPPFESPLTQEVRRLSFIPPLLLERRQGRIEGGGCGEELTGLW